MTRHIILRVMAKLLIPMIMLFALYVQLHGDYGPGGGFQAGVIFGAAVVLYALMFGLDEAARVFPPRVVEVAVALGVLVYGAVGVVTMALGGKFLDYDQLASGHHGQHWGIFFVELGVGLTVAAVMVSLFMHFAGRKQA